MTMDWTSWIPAAVLGFLLFIGRNWIKAGIEKSIQHDFDGKIETLRTTLRKNEEEFKSELRSKEADISALRDGVLGGQANRQALLDKRRIEAVERVWNAVIELRSYKFLSESMTRIKFEAVAEKAPRDPKIRKLFEIFGNTAPDIKTLDNPAKNEQPFISPIAWAYFSAYQSVLMNAYLKAKLLELGIEDLPKLMDTENIKKLLNTALPHQAEFIEKQDSGAYHFLLDELEASLLAELRKMLEGEDIDEASLVRSVNIMKAVESVEKDSANIVQAEDIKAAPDP